MITYALVYLGWGCWSALALSVHGRLKKGEWMAGRMALGIVLLWPLVWLEGMAQAFGEDEPAEGDLHG